MKTLHLSTAKTPGGMRSAFTLIELLVVIAIIAILASILFPVFGRARENARRSSCQSNLKQIGLGMLQYTQDYDEKFPYAWQAAGNFPSWSNGANTATSNDITANSIRYWPYAIQPYLKSAQLFRCPSDTSNAGSSYVVNSYFHLRSQADITSASTTVAMCDGSLGDGGTHAKDNATSAYGLNDDYTIAGSSRRLTNVSFNLPRHLGTDNFLFGDGHVKVSRPLPKNTDANYVATVESVVPYTTFIKPDGPWPGDGGWSDY